MLKDLVNESLIQLNVEATDCEDAIVKAATPLVAAGKIEARYIDAIIKTLHEIGPYFVLVPHVALPHARSTEGAIENALGITTLKQPVEFGSDANDPVKYIFTLSAVDNGQHLEALASLADLFEDSGFFDMLDKALQVEDIVEYIRLK